MLAKSSSICAALTLLTCVCVGTAAADTVRKEFNVNQGDTLQLETDLGSIDVRTDGGTELSIEVQRDGTRAEQLELKFSQRGNKVIVSGELPSDHDNWHNGRSNRVEYTITVPRRFNVDLSTSGGSITVDDLDGTLRARTSGGRLKFGQIEGEVNAHTSGGSVTLEGGGADVRVATSGGSIRVGDVNGSIKAHTSGGSVRVGNATGNIDASTSGGSVAATLTRQPTQDCSLTTSGGSVTLYLADGIGVDISARANGGGNVRSDFEIDGKTRAKRHLKGPLNGGGPRVRLETSGGSVRIKSTT